MAAVERSFTGKVALVNGRYAIMENIAAQGIGPGDVVAPAFPLKRALRL